MGNNKWLKGDFQKELVSVIIPSYNRADFLKEAIDSVWSQTYRPIECIVVDDGSTDHIKQIVANYERYNDTGFNLKYIHQVNSGAQVARNSGTTASSGEFIQYLDSDDLLNPDKLKRQVELLRSNVTYDGVFGDWRKGTVSENDLVKSHDSNDLMAQFLNEHCVVNFSFLMRRAIINKSGKWDVNIKRNQEIDFQLATLLAGARFKYQPGECGLWRIHDGDRIANKTGLKETIHFYKKWEDIFLEKKIFSEPISTAFANAYIYLFYRNIDQPALLLRELVENIYALNKGAGFFNYSKMKYLINFVGEKAAFHLWILKMKVKRKNLSNKLSAGGRQL